MTQARMADYKRCPTCGKEFRSFNKKQRYDTNQCRKKAHKARERLQRGQMQCKWCGNMFEARNSLTKYDTDACKQAAYRARKAAGGQLMF